MRDAAALKRTLAHFQGDLKKYRDAAVFCGVVADGDDGTCDVSLGTLDAQPWHLLSLADALLERASERAAGMNDPPRHVMKAIEEARAALDALGRQSARADA